MRGDLGEPGSITPAPPWSWKLGALLISVLVASSIQLKCHGPCLKSITIFVVVVPSSFIFLLGTLYFKLILLLVDLLGGSAHVTYIENPTPDCTGSK